MIYGILGISPAWTSPYRILWDNATPKFQMMSDLFWWKITVNIPLYTLYRHPNTETKKNCGPPKHTLNAFSECIWMSRDRQKSPNATHFCGSPRSTERARHDRGQSLKEVPHLVMSIGAARNHIYQSNVFGARAGHPLFRRALTHVLMIRNAWALKNYLGFCMFLWQELREDLGRNPALVGVASCRTQSSH